MIVWGGNNGKEAHADGARYDPAQDLWSPMALPPALSGRRRHTVAWTGSEMIVWGGYATVKRNQAAYYLADGGAYAPSTDSWRKLAAAPLAPRLMHAVAWTGREMFIWGGSSGTDENTLSDGATYRPATDSWTVVPQVPSEVAATWPAAAWSGAEVLLWGGLASTAAQAVGARFVP
jgi:N-acetylneuraminic acid mutarotase